MLKVVDSDSFMKEIKQLYDTAFPREEGIWILSRP